MNWKSFANLLILCLAFSTGLWAHESGKHKGQATTGEVVSVAAGKLEIKTSNGPQKVVVNDKTKFFEGDKETTLAKIAPGSQVTVHGTTLASGDIVASEITVGMGSSSHQGHEKMEGHDHRKGEHKH